LQKFDILTLFLAVIFTEYVRNPTKLAKTKIFYPILDLPSTNLLFFISPNFTLVKARFFFSLVTHKAEILAPMTLFKLKMLTL